MQTSVDECYCEIKHEVTQDFLNVYDIESGVRALSEVVQFAIITVLQIVFVDAFLVTAPAILLLVIVLDVPELYEYYLEFCYI
jgi:hypothetical protein